MGNDMTSTSRRLVVGVLALQGAFSEHIQLLRKAFAEVENEEASWTTIEVRTPEQLATCDALVIPGGESTTIALVAERSGLLEPLRNFVKAERKPTWGTCAGLILLAEAANRVKKGGQELIGGIDVRVNRNHFGRQVESFETDLSLDFLDGPEKSFRGVFIRAPVVEKILPSKEGPQAEEDAQPETIIAPSRMPKDEAASLKLTPQVDIMAVLPGRTKMGNLPTSIQENCDGDIIAVRQGNCFGTSFHPELTEDARIHVWWLKQVLAASSS